VSLGARVPRETPSGWSSQGSCDTCSVVAGGGETLGEEPNREDQLEEAAWYERKYSGALGHVRDPEHVQDGSHEQHRIPDDAEDCDRAWNQIR
jgi:hypothetical protein